MDERERAGRHAEVRRLACLLRLRLLHQDALGAISDIETALREYAWQDQPKSPPAQELPADAGWTDRNSEAWRNAPAQAGDTTPPSARQVLSGCAVRAVIQQEHESAASQEGPQLASTPAKSEPASAAPLPMADQGWRLTDAEISSLIYALDYPHTDEDVARDIAEAQGLKALEWAARQCEKRFEERERPNMARDDEALECLRLCEAIALETEPDDFALDAVELCTAAIGARISERAK